MSLFGIGAPAVANIVAGIGSELLGGFMSRSSASEAAEQQFENQKALMELQNQYNVENYKHRHQWEVADLRAAGLNPILSANSGSSVAAASGGTAGMPQATHQYDFSKAINALANSALVKKQTELAEYDAETKRITADADYLRAKNDEARTPSAIAQQDSTARLMVKQTEMLDKNYELQKLYNDANIREIDQRIINSVMEVEAKVQYYKESGQAALMSASAQQASAAAAMRSAEAQQMIAEVAAANGISQRELNDALAGKASAETKEAMERALKINAETGVLDWQLAKDKSHNPFADRFQSGYGINQIFMAAGEILRNGISGGAGFLP